MVVRPEAVLSEGHLAEAQKAASLLLDLLPDSLTYHSKEHTVLCVVPAAHRLALAEGLSFEERVLVEIAAWFHDTGFVARYRGHELVSATFAEQFMRQCAYPFSEDHLLRVHELIMATDPAVPPRSLSERIMKDADLSPLGRHDFSRWSLALFEESARHRDAPLHDHADSLVHWRRFETRFLARTAWWTLSARQLYDDERRYNIEVLQRSFLAQPSLTFSSSGQKL